MKTSERKSTRSGNLFSPKIKCDPSTRILIIGSGITGLCTGALLAKLGCRVTILEAHRYLIGGHARSIDVGGLRFCVGPQFLWNFSGDKARVGEKVLSFLGIRDSIEFIPFDENCQDRLFLGSEPAIDVPRGLSRFCQVLTQRFPEERNQLSMFFSYIDSIFQGSKILHNKGLYLEGKGDMLLEMLSSPHLSFENKLQIVQFHNKTLEQLFDHCGISEKPRRYLYGHGGIFAENAQTVSIGVYAAATGYCHEGISFPLNGFQQIIEQLSAFIRSNNGQVLLDKRVIRVNTESSRVVSVTCADGSEYVADYVISNISPRMTLNLLDKKPKNKNYTYRPSNSLIGCFIGVDRSLGLDNMARKNYWWQTYPEIVNYNDPDMTKEPSMMYVCSETVNGVRYENVDPQLQSLTVFAPGNYAQSKAAYEKDPRIHDELRTEIEQVILETLEKKLFPGLRNSLKFIKVFTPWDIFQELGAEEGNIYGRREDVQSVLRKINPIAGINNLSLACATVGQPGITTGFQTSLIMVEKLTGRQIIG